jgi:hypothetical protein
MTATHPSSDVVSPDAAADRAVEPVRKVEPQPRKSRVWAAYIGFFVAVFASMAAAATVASSDLPLIVVGL